MQILKHSHIPCAFLSYCCHRRTKLAPPTPTGWDVPQSRWGWKMTSNDRKWDLGDCGWQEWDFTWLGASQIQIARDCCNLEKARMRGSEQTVPSILSLSTFLFFLFFFLFQSPELFGARPRLSWYLRIRAEADPDSFHSLLLRDQRWGFLFKCRKCQNEKIDFFFFIYKMCIMYTSVRFHLLCLLRQFSCYFSDVMGGPVNHKHTSESSISPRWKGLLEENLSHSPDCWFPPAHFLQAGTAASRTHSCNTERCVTLQ